MIDALLVGMTVGLALGLAGSGGALLAVPLYLMLIQVSVNDAIGLALGTVAVAAAVGTAMQHRKGQVDWGIAAAFAAFGVPFAPLGRHAASYVSDAILFGCFASVAILIAVKMWGQPKVNNNPAGVMGVLCPAKGIIAVNDKRHYRRVAPWSMLVGFLSGLIGVGGGFLIVPLLSHYGLSFSRALGTSLVVVTMVSLSGFLFHISSSTNLPMPVLVLSSLGSVVGIVLGMKLAGSLSEEKLRRLFALGTVGLMSVSASKIFL